jgi:Ca2+-transporting ATPase
MGITGTDVSKESADMILLDDNFSTIVKAIREGRRVYDNIRKFIRYILTCNGAEILTICVAPVIGLPMPLLPIHLLWINLITDGLPGLALSFEPEEKNVMQRPPRRSNESFFSNGTGIHVLFVGCCMAAVTLAFQYWALANNNPAWQTIVFTVLCFSQLVHVYAIRSEQESLFRVPFFSNRPMIFALAITITLQLAVVYLPAANTFLKTTPLSFPDLMWCILGALSMLVITEIQKRFSRLIPADRSLR